MGTHPIFESDFDCLTEQIIMLENYHQIQDPSLKNKIEKIITLDWQTLEDLASTKTKHVIMVLFREIQDDLQMNDISMYPKIRSNCDRLLQIATSELNHGHNGLFEELDLIVKKIKVLEADIERHSEVLQMKEVEELVKKLKP